MLLVRGTWTSHGAEHETFPGPVAMALTFEQLEGANHRRSFTYRSSGEPCILIEIHFAEADSGGRWPGTPGRVDLDEATWGAALRAGRLDENDDAILVDSLIEVLRRLSEQGLLTASAAARATAPPPRPLSRLWTAVQPLVQRFALSPTVEDLVDAASLTRRQVERALTHWLSSFALVGPGVRSVTHHVRMRAAVLFLSAADASIADVARLVGYGSADAMGRAFRDAGLPSPSEVRRQLTEGR